MDKLGLQKFHLMTENEYQNEIFFEISQLELLNDSLFIFAVPNGELRDMPTAMKLKNMGVRRGISDLICMGNGKMLYIECKRIGGKQSDSQKRFEGKVKKNGMTYILIDPSNPVLEVVNYVRLFFGI